MCVFENDNNKIGNSKMHTRILSVVYLLTIPLLNEMPSFVRICMCFRRRAYGI